MNIRHCGKCGLPVKNSATVCPHCRASDPGYGLGHLLFGCSHMIVYPIMALFVFVVAPILCRLLL